MNILDFVMGQLGRGLTNEERRMLHHLTPQGIAKMNADKTKGIDLEATLRDFRAVFEAMLLRRQRVADSLPLHAQQVVAKLDRPINTTEMAFLHGSCSALLRGIGPADDDGLLIHQFSTSDGSLVQGFDLESSAEAYLFHCLARDATQLATLSQLSVNSCGLVATAVPQNLLAATCLRQRSGSSEQWPRMMLELSPVATWFHESEPTEALHVRCWEAGSHDKKCSKKRAVPKSDNGELCYRVRFCDDDRSDQIHFPQSVPQQTLPLNVNCGMLADLELNTEDQQQDASPIPGQQKSVLDYLSSVLCRIPVVGPWVAQ